MIALYTFKSPTHGKVDMHDMIVKMAEFKKSRPCAETCHVIVGTDSQNFSDTKMVSVIAMYCKGHGGIYFYKEEHLDKIMNVRQKLTVETQHSLQYADKLLEVMMKENPELFDSIHFSIHVDAGNSDKGKTKELVPGIIGWIKASGYDCHSELPPLRRVAS